MKVIAVVRDLFFVARIRETARLVGTPLSFARTPEEIAAALDPSSPQSADLAIVDLTTNGWDYDAIFTALDAAPGLPVLGFTLAVSIVTALLFGLAPAYHACAGNLAEPLKQAARSVSGSLRQKILRHGMVVGEVALSLMLLVAASLMIRTLIATALEERSAGSPRRGAPPLESRRGGRRRQPSADRVEPPPSRSRRPRRRRRRPALPYASRRRSRRWPPVR